MTQQETSGTGEPSLTEEVQTQPETAEVLGTETPAQSTAPAPGTLNRAERRAQAKGKKTPAGPNPNLTSGGAHGPSGRTSGHTGQVRFPRTGHK